MHFEHTKRCAANVFLTIIFSQHGALKFAAVAWMFAAESLHGGKKQGTNARLSHESEKKSSWLLKMFNWDFEEIAHQLQRFKQDVGQMIPKCWRSFALFFTPWIRNHFITPVKTHLCVCVCVSYLNATNVAAAWHRARARKTWHAKTARTQRKFHPTQPLNPPWEILKPSIFPTRRYTPED